MHSLCAFDRALEFLFDLFDASTRVCPVCSSEYGPDFFGSGRTRNDRLHVRRQGAKDSAVKHYVLSFPWSKERI